MIYRPRMIVYTSFKTCAQAITTKQSGGTVTFIAKFLSFCISNLISSKLVRHLNGQKITREFLTVCSGPPCSMKSLGQNKGNPYIFQCLLQSLQKHRPHLYTQTSTFFNASQEFRNAESPEKQDEPLLLTELKPTHFIKAIMTRKIFLVLFKTKMNHKEKTWKFRGRLTSCVRVSPGQIFKQIELMLHCSFKSSSQYHHLYFVRF